VCALGFMGQHPLFAIAANPEQLSLLPQSSFPGVEQHIPFHRLWSAQLKSQRWKLRREGGAISQPDLHFDLKIVSEFVGHIASLARSRPRREFRMKNREQRSRSLNSIIKTTLRLQVAAESVNSPLTQQAIAQAAQLLRAGGTVAFPTETVYGLGANAFDAQAIAGIFLAKQRPSWDPLIVHVSGAAILQKVVASISPRAQKLIDAFWPGPLTLLLPKSVAVTSAGTAGRALVGVRFPAHPVARALIAAAGVPIAAPSANRFGHTSPTTAQHVLDDLDGRIDLVIDNGPTQCGLESTVIEV